MLKNYGSLFAFFQKLVDFLLAAAGWYLIYLIRFYIDPNAQQGLESVFLKAGIVVGAITVFFFSREGLYKSYRLSSRFEELNGVLKANAYSCVALVVTFYFLADERLSRLVILGYFVFSTCGFVVLKISIRNFLRYLRMKGKNLRHLVLVGNGSALERYVGNVLTFRESGVHFIGWIDSGGLSEKYHVPEFADAYLTDANLRTIDGVVICYDGAQSPKINHILDRIYNDITPIVVLPDMSYSFVGHALDYYAGIPAFSVNQPKIGGFDGLLKRIFDFVLSGIGLLFISPILFTLAIGVKLSSPGPIFFGQERVGLDGRKFKMWKFRSMKIGNHVAQSGVPGWTVKDDPRKTKFGSFIRSTSLDELPQLWNVFIGDMSLVGPRPEQPYYVEKFKQEIPAYMLRHKMKAGITGWAQVNGWRGDTSLHKRIECDLYYIRHWSLWFDIKILFLTFWKGFINKNAY
jgi:Undecaprenyl-phosphate glucose phosphotransferase